MQPDHFQRRCPRLGGDVTFGYCSAAGQGRSPCFKVFDCWWERFDVVAYMQARLSPEAFDALSISGPRPKVASLLDLVRQAQARTSTD